MDELLTPERKGNLVKYFSMIVEADVLTNEDALLIIEVLQRACEKRKASLYEEFMAKVVEEGGEE